MKYTVKRISTSTVTVEAESPQAAIEAAYDILNEYWDDSSTPDTFEATEDTV